MTRWFFVFIVAAVGIWTPGALGNCPAGYPNEIFCDDFDTYCPGGGYPGDPKCTSNAVDNVLLRTVWPNTATTENNDAPCGVEVKIEDDQTLINSPFGGCRYPKGDMGQATLRDWTLPGQVLDIHRFVGNVFGNQYAAVAGTDNAPLSIEFFMAANGGKLNFSSSFMELGYGPPTDYLNRANTDYAYSPNCNTYCSPPIAQLPFSILCAQGNPLSALPTGCPSIATAPIHKSIAVGALAVTDPDPCHCGSTLAHASQSTHLTLFDGRAWWVLRSGTPMLSTGTVTALDGGPTNPPPAAVYTPGDFVLSNGENAAKSYNLVRLTIKGSTLKVECTSRIKVPAGQGGFSYLVYSVMDNIPRQYTGPFDRVDMGVGAGCELASNASWSTCASSVASGTERGCIAGRGTFFVDFDDLVLYGGEGYAVIGACCHSNGTCTQELPENCQAAGDVHGGSNTDCNATICCAHGTYVWADGDGDGDVDPDDFSKFQICYTGPGGPMPADLKCKCFNREGNDNDVDETDYQRFKDCATGANVPWSPGFPASCTP